MKKAVRKRTETSHARLAAKLGAGLCLAIGPAWAADPATPAPATEEKKPAAAAEKSAEPEELLNWIEISAGGVFVEGDNAQYKRRHQGSDSAFGGVESFHWEEAVGKKGLFKVDGRGIADNHDYSIKLDLSRPDRGYLRAGYRESRTWYDGSGGFLPQTGLWLSLYNEDLHVDRGEAFFEGGLTLPDLPSISFRYSHQFRDGLKDSTSWGDTSLTGSNNALDRRGVVPSFRSIDETRDIFEGKIKYRVQKTDLGLGLRYELSDVNNSLNVNRRPGEPAADRFVTSRDEVKLDLFDVHGFTETRFSEKLLLSTGYAFTTLDTDLSGSRIYGASYELGYDPATLGRRQFGDQGFTDLTGGSQMKEYVFNVNLMAMPWDSVSIVPSLRVERQDLEGTSQFMDTMDTLGATLPPVASQANTDRGTISVSERLDVRYTGFTNWVLYARTDWAQEQGNLHESLLGRVAGSLGPFPESLSRDTDFSRITQKYAVGANWYPARRVTMAWQYYHKMRNNDYDHSNVVRPAAVLPKDYPGFINENDFDTDDVNFRITLRPLNNLTFVSRYDFQLSTIDVQDASLPQIQSARTTTHIFGESVTWNPLARLYLQGTISYILDKTETPADGLTGAQANLVDPSRNDYWNASVTAGYALDDKTDLQTSYFYYRSDDSYDNSAVSVPYGASAQEHGVTVGLIRRISPRVRWTLKYGFFNNRDYASGGNNNYDAHLIYSSVQYRF